MICGHGSRGGGHIDPANEIAKGGDPAKTRRLRPRITKEKFANPYKAAELGFIDEVIYPRTLRARLAQRASSSLKDNVAATRRREAHEHSALDRASGPAVRARAQGA